MTDSALSGIKILDLSRLLPFNYCTLMLADLGAEVIKVEEPILGDYMRWMHPKMKNENAAFIIANRNKKSLTLNLREEEGKEILRKLVREYDVLFESFRPGVMEKLGLGYDKLKKINPDLVYCSSTGYGQNGPYKDRPGHDVNYLSVSGILSATRDHTGKPVILGVPVADMSVGIFSAFSILAALLARNRIGKGQQIDVSMTDCMVSYNIINIGNFIARQQSEPSAILELTEGYPCYNVFETKDGKFISLGNIEEKFWINFLKVIGREDLKEFQFSISENKKMANDELQDLFLSKTQKEWLDKFEGEDICYSAVNEIDDLVDSPLVNRRKMLIDIEDPKEGKMKTIGFPIKFSSTPAKISMLSPSLGQHTEEILKKLGYDDMTITGLKKRSVV